MAEVNQLFLTDKARELYSRFTLRPEKSMTIIGSLLGDASLLVTDKDRIPNFYENHSMKQLEYLKWKAMMLGKPDGVRFRVMTHGYLKGQSVPYFELRSKEFLSFEKMFYIIGNNGKRKKIVTKEALDLLVGSRLALSIFHMDDGEYNVYSNQLLLHTCDFTMEENEMMARQLEDLLGEPVRVKIKKKLHPKPKLYPKLALSSKATDKFIAIIRPFIHPTLSRKIDQEISHYIDHQIVVRLREIYGKKPTMQIAKELGITRMETYVIAYRLGLTENNNYIRYREQPFTDEEKEYVLKNYTKSDEEQMAVKLHTTPNYLHHLVYELRKERRINSEKGKAGESACVLLYNARYGINIVIPTIVLCTGVALLGS